MFTHLHYIPILKSKNAEFVALRQLSPRTKKLLTPMINVLPVPWDHQKEKGKETLDAHLEDIGIKIAKNWGIDRPIFVDPFYISTIKERFHGRHPFTYLWQIASRQYAKIVPVIGLDNDDDYLNTVEEVVSTDKHGVCIRIIQEDIDNFDTVDASIQSLLARLGSEHNMCDIIIDFKALPLADVGDPISYVVNLINNFPSLESWRTFTIAATNFPQYLSEMKPDSDITIPRTEFLMWKGIIASGKSLSRLPSFGDYAIEHPAYQDLDLKNRRVSVNLRYTTNSDWLVFKKRDKDKFGHGQFHDLCDDLVKRREQYCGPAFSASDKYIHLCSMKSARPGSPPIWRQIGFNHHLEFVAKQISSFRVAA